MPHVTFLVLAFNADAFLEPVLESILPFGPVRVVEGPVAYFARQGYETSTDRTNEILHDLVGAENVVHGTWSEKDEMMNASVPLVPADTEFMWMVDADEVYEPAVLARTLAHLHAYDSVSFKPWTFFGGFERILTGFETAAEWVRIQRWHAGARWQTHRPPTVLDPQGRPYRNARHWESPEHFFHYSYVMPASTRAKVAYYTSWGAGVIPHWFERVYLPWVVGNWHTQRDIELAYEGVHEWLPERRGECFTAPWLGTAEGVQHPDVIERRLPPLRARFQRELRFELAVRESATKETL